MSDSGGKLNERLAYLGALAGGLAHEIRNPLSTINLNLQLLLEDWENVEGERGRRARRKLEVIQKEAKRLEEILNDFLRVVRGEELKLEEHDLNDVVEEILDLITPAVRSENIQIRRGLSTGLPRIRFDQALLKQAIINLFKNAREAMGGGGELIVRTARSGDHLRVDIADTGPGIPPEKQERIFRPYYTTKKAGTGLGLASTKRIIEEHGGDISFTSEVGKGTNFTIRLPVTTNPASES
ncbi:MAG: two-component sensor histidine kinase [Planctomycetes bacterium]|nr:two-component sensor histidine kinase [Planctomycetota bacterium]